MFSPTVKSDDGWYIVPGVLVDGTTVDLIAALSVQSNASSGFMRPVTACVFHRFSIVIRAATTPDSDIAVSTMSSD